MQPWGFTSRAEHHWPRIRRSLLLVVLGAPLLALGIYWIVNDLPELSSSRNEVRARCLPVAVGGAALTFGLFGLATGVLGVIRKDDDAIDLELGDAGITVRGGHVIPWGSVTGATAVQHVNGSKVQLLWSRKDLNRDLVLRLKEHLDVPGAAFRNGRHTVRVRLLRYPAADYQKVFAEVVAKLRSRKIQVVEARRHKQT